MARGLITLLLFILALPATADIYKQVDENGKVIYSDTPGGTRVQQVDLPPINTQPATPVTTPARKKVHDQPALPFRVSITSPADGTHIPAGQRDIEVVVRVDPGLQPGYTLQAYLNNVAYGPASSESAWILEQVYRGEHTLNVDLLDPDGHAIATSDSVTLYVFRPTVNSPQGKAKSGN